MTTRPLRITSHYPQGSASGPWGRSAAHSSRLSPPIHQNRYAQLLAFLHFLKKKPHSSSIQKLLGTHSGQGGTGTIFHYFLRFKSGPKKSSLALLGGSLTYELINLCISESICSQSLTFVLFESPYTAESYKWKHVSSLRGCERGLIPTQKPFHFHTRSTLEGPAQS